LPIESLPADGFPLENLQQLDSYGVVSSLVSNASPQSGTGIAPTRCEKERNAVMKNPKWDWHVTVVDVLVGFAVLMILSALVVPVFIPPEGKVASRAAAHSTSAKPTQR